jgi:hypothetical protein
MKYVLVFICSLSSFFSVNALAQNQSAVSVEAAKLTANLDDIHQGDRQTALSALSIWTVKNWPLDSATRTFVIGELVKFLDTEPTRWSPDTNNIHKAYEILATLNAYDEILAVVEKYSDPKKRLEGVKDGYTQPNFLRGINKPYFVLTIRPYQLMPTYFEDPVSTVERNWNSKVSNFIDQVLSYSSTIKDDQHRYLDPAFTYFFLEHVMKRFCSKSILTNPYCSPQSGNEIVSLKHSPKTIELLKTRIKEAYSADQPVFYALYNFWERDPQQWDSLAQTLQDLSETEEENKPKKYIQTDIYLGSLRREIDSNKSLGDIVAKLKQSPNDPDQMRALSTKLDVLKNQLLNVDQATVDQSAEVIRQIMTAVKSRIESINRLPKYSDPRNDLERDLNRDVKILFRLAHHTCSVEEERALVADSILAEPYIVVEMADTLVELFAERSDASIDVARVQKIFDTIQTYKAAEKESQKEIAKQFYRTATTYLSYAMDHCSYLPNGLGVAKIRELLAGIKTYPSPESMPDHEIILPALRSRRGRSATYDQLAIDVYTDSTENKSINNLIDLVKVIRDVSAPDTLQRLRELFAEMTRNSPGDSKQSIELKQQLGLR